MIEVGILTVSDKGFNGQRIDETGPTLSEYLKEYGYKVQYYKVVPDEIEEIEDELKYMCDNLGLNLVITSGGTGFSKRDVTPEATLKVIEKYVPGIGEVMRMKSFEITKRSMLSRGIAGIRKNSLIINLPGSPKGAKENLEFILPALGHGIQVLIGQGAECGMR